METYCQFFKDPMKKSSFTKILLKLDLYSKTADPLIISLYDSLS